MNLTAVTEKMRDMRVSGAGRTARLPDKFHKRLMERLEKIAMGRDAQCSAPLFRQTIGAFYSSVMDAATMKRLKENRSVEELLLLFFNSAQTSLKKRVVDEDERKSELQQEVQVFVRIVRETLRNSAVVPKELNERIDEYASLLGAPGGVPRPPSASSSPRPDQAVEDDTPAADAPMIVAVGKLFDVEGVQLLRDVDSVRPMSTMAAGMVDLKRIVYRIHAQQPWPGAPDDFVSIDEYKKWRSAELNALSQLMVDMCRLRPELLSNASTSDSTAARMPRKSTDGSMSTPELVADNEEDGELTFVPSDTTAAYQRVLERCIDVDLDAIRKKSEEEEVSLGILSPLHLQLLDVLAERWRIPRAFRALANLRVVKARYDCGDIPFECLGSALDQVVQVVQEVEPPQWRKHDQQAMRRSLDSLADTLLRGIYSQFQAVEAANMDEMQPTIELVERIQVLLAALGQQDTTPKQLHELNEAMRINAIQHYTSKTAELLGGGINTLDAFGQLLSWIQDRVKVLDRKFSTSILSVSPVDVVIQKLVPLYLDDLASMREAVLQQVIQTNEIGDVNEALGLFERVRALMALYAASNAPTPLHFPLRRWFAPYVEQWLALTEVQASKWVQNALQADSFAAADEEETQHSTSITDLSVALRQPLQFLLNLQWPDKYEQACFFTMLAKSYSRLMEQYCHAIEDLFMAEMLPAPDEPAPLLGGFLDGQLANEYVAALPPKQAAWVAKAKQTIAGEKKIQPFLFQPASCVKLNNIEAARKLLDDLYKRMDADRQAKIVAEQLHALPEDEGDDSAVGLGSERAPLHYLFSVKLVQAELLDAGRDEGDKLANRLDTFVTLSDESGMRLAKTRTIYDTYSPRWDEVFDIPASSLLWVSTTVWQRRFGSEPTIYGRAPLRLDPRVFRDQNAHEVWLTLDGSGGKVLVRISMEDAHDDILFHFGRAFRVLKRSEVDMVRVLVDHMSLFMRQFLSRSVVRSLVRGGRVNLDRAIGNVKALYASAVAQANGTAALIPPVDERKRSAALSDQELEAAIVPLLDYFEETLGTLKSSLSEDQAQFVLTRVWKEVLSTLESILVPPLSDAPSDMRQLSDKEVDIVFKWLSFLKSYFNAYDEETGVAHGVPLDILQGPKYRELISYLLLHDQTTDQLMVECVRGFQTRLAKSPAERRAKSKSVLNQRSLGTIRKHKRIKAEEDHTHTDMAMKILRMRPGTGDFLTQQLISMNSLQQSLTRPTPSASQPGLRRTSKRLSSLFNR